MAASKVPTLNGHRRMRAKVRSGTVLMLNRFGQSREMASRHTDWMARPSVEHRSCKLVAAGLQHSRHNSRADVRIINEMNDNALGVLTYFSEAAMKRDPNSLKPVFAINFPNPISQIRAGRPSDNVDGIATAVLQGCDTVFQPPGYENFRHAVAPPRPSRQEQPSRSAAPLHSRLLPPTAWRATRYCQRLCSDDCLGSVVPRHGQ